MVFQLAEAAVPPTVVRGDSAAYRAAAAAGSATPMIVALSDLQEHDSPGAIGTSWRGENRLQIAQTPGRACEPRANHSLMRKTNALRGAEKVVYPFALALDVRGLGCDREIPVTLGP